MPSDLAATAWWRWKQASFHSCRRDSFQTRNSPLSRDSPHATDVTSSRCRCWRHAEAVSAVTRWRHRSLLSEIQPSTLLKSALRERSRPLLVRKYIHLIQTCCWSVSIIVWYQNTILGLFHLRVASLPVPSSASGVRHRMLACVVITPSLQF